MERGQAVAAQLKCAANVKSNFPAIFSQDPVPTRLSAQARAQTRKGFRLTHSQRAFLWQGSYVGVWSCSRASLVSYTLLGVRQVAHSKHICPIPFQPAQQLCHTRRSPRGSSDQHSRPAGYIGGLILELILRTCPEVKKVWFSPGAVTQHSICSSPPLTRRGSIATLC